MEKFEIEIPMENPENNALTRFCNIGMSRI